MAGKFDNIGTLLFTLLLVGIGGIYVVGLVFPTGDYTSTGFQPENLKPSAIAQIAVAGVVILGGFWLVKKAFGEGGIRSPKEFYTIIIAAVLLYYGYKFISGDLNWLSELTASVFGLI